MDAAHLISMELSTSQVCSLASEAGYLGGRVRRAGTTHSRALADTSDQLSHCNGTCDMPQITREAEEVRLSNMNPQVGRNQISRCLARRVMQVQP